LAKFGPKKVIGFSKSVSLPWNGGPAPDKITSHTRKLVQKTAEIMTFSDETFPSTA